MSLEIHIHREAVTTVYAINLSITSKHFLLPSEFVMTQHKTSTQQRREYTTQRY